MHVGLYFGSFNPVHIGHLIIASHCRHQTDLEQVWIVLSPNNPLKPSASLLNEYHRLHLLQVAITEDPFLRASDIEFHLPRPSYTVNTMAYLAEKYPQHRFSIIMGSDSFSNLRQWHQYQYLVSHHTLYIYKRPGFEVTNDLGADLRVLDAPLLEISSTQIRKMIREGQSARYLLHDNTLREIEQNGYYRQIPIGDT